MSNSAGVKVTVLMPVFQTPLLFVKQAVESILNQSYRKFQFLIIDDNNPKGELCDYLYSLIGDNCCVDVVRTQQNKGLASTLDFGIEYATGNLIVRMDSDDIAYPDLIARHVDFFSLAPYAAVCGVQIRLFSDERKWFSHHPAIVTKEMAANNNNYWFMNHPGCAYRTDVIKKIGGYGDTPAHFAEDYALWIKFLKAGYVIYNNQEVLLDYRVQWEEKTHQDRRSKRWLDFLSKQKRSLNE